METFEDFRAHSPREPDVFWAEQAGLIEWQSPPKQVCDYSNPPFTGWFVGGGPIFATTPSVTRYEVPGVNATTTCCRRPLAAAAQRPCATIRLVRRCRRWFCATRSIFPRHGGQLPIRVTRARQWIDSSRS